MLQPIMRSLAHDLSGIVDAEGLNQNPPRSCRDKFIQIQHLSFAVDEGVVG